MEKERQVRLERMWVPDADCCLQSSEGKARGEGGFVLGSGCVWLKLDNPGRAGSQQQAQGRKDLAVSSLKHLAAASAQ